MPFGGGSYEIRIKGRLSDSLLAAFEGLTATVETGETVLRGPVQDGEQVQQPWPGDQPSGRGRHHHLGGQQRLVEGTRRGLLPVLVGNCLAHDGSPDAKLEDSLGNAQRPVSRSSYQCAWAVAASGWRSNCRGQLTLPG